MQDSFWILILKIKFNIKFGMYRFPHSAAVTAKWVRTQFYCYRGGTTKTPRILLPPLQCVCSAAFPKKCSVLNRYRIKNLIMYGLLFFFLELFIKTHLVIINRGWIRKFFLFYLHPKVLLMPPHTHVNCK